MKKTSQKRVGGSQVQYRADRIRGDWVRWKGALEGYAKVLSECSIIDGQKRRLSGVLLPMLRVVW